MMGTMIPRYQKVTLGQVVNGTTVGDINTLSTVGDVNGDGYPDVVISGRNGQMVWLENPGRPDGTWRSHLIAPVAHMECGGQVIDLTGNGLGDVINGNDGGADAIWWFENPGVVGQPWTQRLIARTGQTQFHDTLTGDLYSDGRRWLIFTNQHGAGGTTVYAVPIPGDPFVSPWPGLEVIASGKHEPNPLNPWRRDGLQPEEGLALGDIDGDGRNELVSGTHWYKFDGTGWRGHKFASGYLSTKCAIADVNGDGRNEILLSEGDPVIYGKTEGGMVAWFTPGADPTALWTEHVVDEGLLDAHSLLIGDLTGRGQADLFIGEVGHLDPASGGFQGHAPRLMIYANDGRGHFTRYVIAEGSGIHDATLVDLYRQGQVDIVGKPLHGPDKWAVHAYRQL
jgi:hypothetical protein